MLTGCIVSGQKLLHQVPSVLSPQARAKAPSHVPMKAMHPRMGVYIFSGDLPPPQKNSKCVFSIWFPFKITKQGLPSKKRHTLKCCTEEAAMATAPNCSSSHVQCCALGCSILVRHVGKQVTLVDVEHGGPMHMHGTSHVEHGTCVTLVHVCVCVNSIPHVPTHTQLALSYQKT